MKQYKSDFSIKEFSEYAEGELDPLYGMDTYNITEKDIEALKNGKVLYSTVNDDEYAIVIGLGSVIDKNIKEDLNE